MIKIKCTGTEELPLDKIKEFQGALKKRTKAQKEKLLESLKTYGFSFPFFIWKNEGINWCLDGHGRLEVLNSLLNKDQLPTFPVVYVQAEDEAEAKKKLLQLNSQYGEIDTEGLQEFIDGIDIDTSEFEIPEIQEEWFTSDTDKTSGERGGHYNDEEAPEIEPRKGMHRIEACSFLSKRETAIELFAGRGALSFWYRRLFKNVITNDIQEFDDIKHDHTMKAERFILENITSETRFDLIDFDDEGCPAKEIQLFFEKIKERKDPFILAITDGNGLNLKSRGRLNFYKTYMIRDDKTVQASGEDYECFEEIFREFIEKVTAGWRYNELSLFRKDNGNVIYATYYIYR